jgi:hypothetical protein
VELRTEDFLDGRHANTAMAVVANLFAEVVVLQERVRQLEARLGQPGAASDPQAEVDEAVARVFSPLKADSALP